MGILPLKVNLQAGKMFSDDDERDTQTAVLQKVQISGGRCCYYSASS